MTDVAPSGTPAARNPAEPLLAVLRGVSQIFFVRHAGAGLVILAGLACFHPWFALLVLLGSAVQTLGAWALARSTGSGRELPDGMMGYNGALVGAAAGFYEGDSRQAFLLCAVGALACVPVHELFRRLFSSRALSWAGLPVSTAPFCTVAGLLACAVPTLFSSATTTSSRPFVGSDLGLLNGYSEVILADGALTGALVIAALFLGSWRIALFSLLGGVVGVLGEQLLGHGTGEISSGLLVYSAVLAAIGIGAVCWSERRTGVRVAGAVVAALLTLAIQPLLALTPVPVFTWPFLLAMWLVLLATGWRHRA